jgi:hypothetical protein
VAPLSSFLRPAVVFAALASVLALASCKRSVTSVCRQQCECSPCTDYDLDQCVETAEKAAEKAAKANCVDQFDDLIGCYDDNLSCKAAIGTGTDECADAERLLRNCSSSVPNPFLSVCAQAQIKFNTCIGSNQPPEEQDNCTGATACQAACVVDATCPALLNGETSFIECVSSCQDFGSGGFGPK